jgi:hypothetical protein
MADDIINVRGESPMSDPHRMGGDGQASNMAWVFFVSAESSREDRRAGFLLAWPSPPMRCGSLIGDSPRTLMMSSAIRLPPHRRSGRPA